MRSRVTGLFLVTLAGFAVHANAGLAKDEKVRFFPGYARWDEARSGWRARLRGWVYEPERGSLPRQVLIQSLLRWAPPDGDRKLFQARAQSFLVDTEEGKTLRPRWGTLAPRKVRSGEEGALGWEAVLPQSPERAAGTVVPVRLKSGNRMFEGRVLLIGPEGLSVVSDIDDTVKISSVTARDALVANTFFRPWRSVPGMAALYQQWAARGAVFHYVSNSPWPLEQELDSFLTNEGFPAGSTHLRPLAATVTLVEEIFRPEGRHKLDVLDGLLTDFPQRRFILVGDSAERDPEIYGELARRFSGQVARVLIRRVTPDAPGRYDNAFRNVSPDLWTVFDEPGALSREVRP